MPVVVLLFFCGCGHLFHGAGDENRALFQERVRKAGAFTGSVVYNGEMECRGRSYPFIMGSRVGESKSEFHFYSPSGDVVYGFTQEKTGNGFSIVENKEERGDGEILAMMRKFVAETGDEVSLAGILLAGFPRVPSSGYLFKRRKGFLYEGEGFTLRADESMRITDGELALEDELVKVHYVYEGVDGEIPSGVDLSYGPCSVHLSLEKVYRGKN